VVRAIGGAMDIRRRGRAIPPGRRRYDANSIDAPKSLSSKPGGTRETIVPVR